MASEATTAASLGPDGVPAVIGVPKLPSVDDALTDLSEASVPVQPTETQQAALQGDINPHLLIMRRHKELQLKAAIQTGLKEAEKAPGGLNALGATMSSDSSGSLNKAPGPQPFRTQVHMLENKQWQPRTLVLRDGDDVATLTIFPADAPEVPAESTRLLEIRLLSGIEVGDYVEAVPLTGRLTMRKATPRPNAFSLLVGDQTFSFEAADVLDKSRWMKEIDTALTRARIVDMGIAPAVGADVTAAQPGEAQVAHRGTLSVLEKKQWVQRTVEVRDGDTPLLAIYVGESSAAAEVPITEIRFTGATTDVGDYVEAVDLTGRLTLRKSTPRPNAFTVVVGDASCHFEAATAAEKVEWVDKILKVLVRYRVSLTSKKVAVKAKDLVRPHTGYLGVQEKGNWVARLVVLRDATPPTVSIYDASSKVPPQEELRLRDIELVGFADVGDFRMPENLATRLTLRSKEKPRPNSFTLIVNETMHHFEAPSENIKRAWIGKLWAIIERENLHKNDVIAVDKLKVITHGLRKALSIDRGEASLSGSNSALASAAVVVPPSKPAVKLDSVSDFQNLPEGVINPLDDEPDGRAVFQNQLFSED